MRLRWVSDEEVRAMGDLPYYPEHRHGYWLASTDSGSNDGTGGDPLTAVSNLAAQMERERS